MSFRPAPSATGRFVQIARQVFASALESPEVVGGDHHHLVAPAHRHVLRALAADAAHESAEARRGVLQRPDPLRMRQPG
ncbi:hypothetical protein ASG63_22320 [Methylobacterium sp. Leaf94]|nr:hypothetical protein ASG63_22320 [Methylobacterium sp. Leaf94]